MIDNINHQSPLEMSDHEVLEFKVVLEGKLINTTKNMGHLSYQRGYYQSINQILANTNWDFLSDCEDSEDLRPDLQINYRSLLRNTYRRVNLVQGGLTLL